MQLLLENTHNVVREKLNGIEENTLFMGLVDHKGLTQIWASPSLTKETVLGPVGPLAHQDPVQVLFPTLNLMRFNEKRDSKQRRRLSPFEQSFRYLESIRNDQLQNTASTNI